MKKIFVALSICLLTACAIGTPNSPKEKVKELLDKYKTQDSAVISDLDETIDKEYEGEYKDRYKKIMINQYKDMDYEITDEVIDGDTAIVTAKITVYDYATAISKANSYLSTHEDEFYKESDNKIDKVLDNDKFLDYKLEQLESVKDKKSYEIEFSLNKNNENNDWVIDSLSNSDIEKIHGLYLE